MDVVGYSNLLVNEQREVVKQINRPAARQVCDGTGQFNPGSAA